MTNSLWQAILADHLFQNREEINRENRLALRLLAVIGLPLSILNTAVQMQLASSDNVLFFLLSTSWVFLYFLMLLLVERWVIPKEFSHTTALLYVAEAPVLVTSIMLGSFWDPVNQAISFFIFLMAMPVFVLDRPIRVTLITLAWTLLFLMASHAVKTPEIFQRDLLHAAEFFLAAIAIANVVIRIRLISLERLEQATHHLEHDELTDLRNRRSLERHANEYVGKNLAVLVIELDELSAYNDFYGHEFGNQLLIAFAGVASKAFGHEHCFRYGGNEILCMSEGKTEQEILDIVEQSRTELEAWQTGEHKLSPTYACGLVMGAVDAEEDLRRMIQMADINAHKAGKNGRGQLCSSVYSEAGFLASTIESTIETHVRAYETNQLTGLPSMSFFIIRAEEVLNAVVDMARNPMIGFFNLPHIKSYNSEFGYAQGDELIRHTAQLLRQAFPDRLLCCITGSQFGIMCYQDEVQPGIEMVRSNLLAYKKGFPVECKAGFASYVEGESTISLLDKARIAEKSIRASTGSCVRFYDEQLDAEIKNRNYIVTHLDEAIERGHLEVYYQPIMRTGNGKICNEEALSRWNDPIRGLLPPPSFIPALEESRQIYKLSLHVVQRVLEDFKRKQELGVPLVPVSVNLSRYDFEQCDMVTAISRLVDASGFSRDMIRIEITESAFMKNQELLKREVNRFRESGFEVWMDDFGSEYSTLNLLQDLDFDLIKIDMQFMRNSENSDKNLIIVSNIVNMAKQMNIATLVEGVETDEHRSFLEAVACDKLQGFLYSKPLPLDEITSRFTGNGRLAYEQAPQRNADNDE